MVGEPFQQWVAERIEARNEKLASDNNQMIEVDPQIAAAFAASSSLSSKQQSPNLSTLP